MKGLVELLKVVGNISIHYILLSVSILFVFISILTNRYFFETFFTFIYILGVAYLTLVRKHEAQGKFFVGSKSRFFLYTTVFIFWFFFWLMGIWTYSKYFPKDFPLTELKNNFKNLIK